MNPLVLLAIGAGLQGIAGGMASKQSGGSFWGGKPAGFAQVDALNPQQQAFRSNMLGLLQGPQQSGMDWISDILGGSPEAFAKYERPYMRQFEQEIVPGIAERFAGLGSHGAQSSSGQQLAMAQAGRELSENLASMRGKLQSEALGRLQGMLQLGMAPTQESVYQQPQAGFLGGLAGGSGQGIGMLGGLTALQRLGILGNQGAA